VAELGDAELAHSFKIGFVFQQFHLLPQLSALENVMLPMVYAGVLPQTRSRHCCPEASGVREQANNKPNQLSGDSNG